MTQTGSQSQTAEDQDSQGLTAVRLLKYSGAAMGLLLLAGAVASGAMFIVVFIGSELGEVDLSVSATRELEVELAGDDRVVDFDFSVAMDEDSLHGLSGPPGVSVEVGGRWIPVGREPTEASTVAGLLVPQIRAEVSPIPQNEGTHDASTAAHDTSCPTVSACSWPFRVKLTREDDTSAPVTVQLRIGAGVSYAERVPDEAAVDVRFDTLGDNIRIVNLPDPHRQPVYWRSVDPSIEPVGFVSFVRTHTSTDATVAVRFPTATTEPSPLGAVVEPLAGGGRTTVSFGGSSTFKPFTGCPADELCVRQYRISPLGGPLPDRTPSLAFHAPEGVIVERELADLPPLDDPLTVQASQTVQIEPGDHAAASSSYLVIETARPMEDLPIIAARLHARLTSPQTGPVEFSLQGPTRTISTDRRPEAAIGRYVSTNHDPCTGKRECRIWLGGDFFNHGPGRVDVIWTLTAAIDQNSIDTEVADLRIELS